MFIDQLNALVNQKIALSTDGEEGFGVITKVDGDCILFAPEADTVVKAVIIPISKISGVAQL